MKRVSVGYQDACLHPLWLTNLGLRIGRLSGADSLWLPDHYIGFIPPQVWRPEHTGAAKVVHSSDGFFDPVQILAVAAVKMPGVTVGTLVTEAIRRHPMALAQSFVTLDHIAKGKAILGIGNGEKLNIAPYGLPWNKQVSRLEEALEIIHKLWSSKGQPITYEGKFWQLKDAIFNVPLYDNRAPKIWVASHAPRMLGLTGRYADGWLPTLKFTQEEYRQRLGAIHDSAKEHGRDIQNFVPGMAMICALGESRDQVIETAMQSRLGAAMSMCLPAEAWKEQGLSHPLGDKHKGFIDIVPPTITDEQIEAAAKTMTPELLLGGMYAGSAAEIRDEIAPIVEAGAQHLIVSNTGAAFNGGSPKDFIRLSSLIRKLRRLKINAEGV